MAAIDQSFHYQEIIDQNRDFLSRNVISERYLQFLREHNVLSQEDCEEISNRYVHQTSQTRAGRFLDILYTKGPAAFDKFLERLEYENPAVFEQLTSKKARKPPPGFIADLKGCRGSVIIPHLAFMAKTLEEKYHEAAEIRGLIDSLSTSNQALEDKVNVLQVKNNKLGHKCHGLKLDNKHLLERNQTLQREKELLYESSLGYKKETDASKLRSQQYMMERDAMTERYNALKQERDAITVDVSKFKDRWNSEVEKSMRLQKDCERAPRRMELETLRTENEQLHQQVAQQKSLIDSLEVQVLQNVQTNYQEQVTILKEQYNDAMEKSSETGSQLCATQQQLHDVEGEKKKMAEQLNEVELTVKNLKKESLTYKEQGEDLRTQLKKIQMERDEAISQRNTAQKACEQKIEERDQLVASKHNMQAKMDLLNNDICHLENQVRKLQQELEEATGTKTRYSGDSGEYSMDRSFSEDDISESSGIDNWPDRCEWTSSLLVEPSCSIKRKEPRYVEEDSFRVKTLYQRESHPHNLPVPSTPIMDSSPSSTHSSHLLKTSSVEVASVSSSARSSQFKRSRSLPGNCKMQNRSASLNERNVSIPASFLQDFVEIRGEIVIGFYVFCVNTKQFEYDIREMDQVLQVECSDRDGVLQSLTLRDGSQEGQDRVRYAIMCAQPDSQINLCLMHNPEGFRHLQSVYDKVKITEDPFFIRSNMEIDSHLPGYLNIHKGDILMVLHKAVERSDRTGKPAVDRYGNLVYDWFACKIDKKTGDADQFGHILSENRASELLSKCTTSPLKLLGKSTLDMPFGEGSIREVPYQRLHQYKKLLVIYGPCQLRHTVQQELRLKHDFLECTLENRICSEQEVVHWILKNEILHCVKCGVSNFSALATESVKKNALNYFCIADVDVQDVVTFSSRLKAVGMDLNVVFLRPSQLMPPGTLWSEICSNGSADVNQELQMGKKTEDVLLRGQSYDAIDLGSVEIRTVDDLLLNIVQICYREPLSKIPF